MKIIEQFLESYAVFTLGSLTLAHQFIILGMFHAKLTHGVILAYVRREYSMQRIQCAFTLLIRQVAVSAV